MRALSWINMVLGLWLLVTAFVFPRGPGAIMAVESVAGIMIAVLAYSSSVARPAPGVSWCVVIAGIWTLIVNYGVLSVPRVNASIVGVVVVILGTVNAVYRQHLTTPS